MENTLITINEVSERINEILVENTFSVPLTENKGKLGLWVELQVGLTNNSKHTDCIDGELKTFPLKTLKNGTIVPKETIAITMINRQDIISNEFENSLVYTKIRRTLFLPFLRNKDNVTFYPSILININENSILFNQLKQEYNNVRNVLLNGKELNSRGNFIQTRTKGSKTSKASKKPKTRAWYFKTKFIKEYLLM
jgi:DNA mismatch repair protein MutH